MPIPPSPDELEVERQDEALVITIRETVPAARSPGCALRVIVFVLIAMMLSGFIAAVLLGYLLFEGALLAFRRPRERERMRVTSDGVQVCMSGPRRERGHVAIAAGDLLAVDPGTREDGLTLIGRRRRITFGAHLSPQALAWCQHAIAERLDGAPPIYRDETP